MAALKNARHEAFARGVALLKPDVDAYREAFGCKQSTAEANATRMRERSEVSARILEIQAASATATTLTMQRRREIAREIADSPQAKNSDRLNAIVIDAKLAGEYNEKVQVSGNIDHHTITEERRHELMERRQKALKFGSS